MRSRYLSRRGYGKEIQKKAAKEDRDRIACRIGHRSIALVIAFCSRCGGEAPADPAVEAMAPAQTQPVAAAAAQPVAAGTAQSAAAPATPTPAPTPTPVPRCAHGRSPAWRNMTISTRTLRAISTSTASRRTAPPASSPTCSCKAPPSLAHGSPAIPTAGAMSRFPAWRERPARCSPSTPTTTTPTNTASSSATACFTARARPRATCSSSIKTATSACASIARTMTRRPWARSWWRRAFSIP